MNKSNACTTAADEDSYSYPSLILFLKIEKYLGPPLLVFGIICNILALFTLRQPKLKESPFIHLMGLTLADLTALVLIFINLYTVQGNRSWLIYVCYVYYPLSNVAAAFCVWIMVVMTLERCIFMQFPLWAPIWCTNSSAKFKIVLVFMICFVVSIPRFFWYQIETVHCHRNFSENETIFVETTGHVYLRHYMNGSLFTNILTWAYSCFLNYLPVTILLSLNSFLIYKIRAQQKRRIQLGVHNIVQLGRMQDQTRLTITLIAITGIYIVLVLPSAFADWNIGSILFFNMPKELTLFQHVSNFLVWLNLSFNFLMYTFVNVKFMRAFKKMLTRWCSQLYGCVVCVRFLQPRIHKMNSSTTTSDGRRTKEYGLRRHPAQQHGRRSCSSRLLTSRGFI